MPSLRLRCVTSRKSGSESSSTAKPWFCDVISTAPVSQILHRVIRAAVAELQLERLRAAGQAEQLVAQADAEDRLLAQQAANRADRVLERLRDRPGRSRGTRRPARWASTSSAVAVPGRIVTRQPMSNRCRGMFHFMPKSSATTCGPTGLIPAPCSLLPATLPFRCVHSLSGCCHSLRLIGQHFAHQVAADQPWAGLAPWPRGSHRRDRPSRARPSSPRPTAAAAPVPACRSIRWPRCPTCRRYSLRLCSERKLLCVRLCSRTTKPANCGRRLSTSSALTP